MNCPGGPSERDFNTGECLYSHQPKGRYNKPFTQSWNDMKYVWILSFWNFWSYIHLIHHFGNSYKYRFYFYHPSHVYRSSPMSSHFVRSMILMRKGWILQRCNQAWNKIVVLNCWWKGWNRISSSWWTVQWITWTFLFCMQWNIKFTHVLHKNWIYNDFFCKVWRNIFLNI